MLQEVTFAFCVNSNVSIDHFWILCKFKCFLKVSFLTRSFMKYPFILLALKHVKEKWMNTLSRHEMKADYSGLSNEQ